MRAAPVGELIPHLSSRVKTTLLDNGLKVIVLEDHSAPVVSAQAWCMSGSIHEGKWLGAGLSHLLEHMLFKGTTSRPGNRIDREVQEAGGHMNAYTSFDRTVYHIDVPSTGTAVALDILCDIMQNASLPLEELAKEMQVIVREMDMNTDDPGRRASRRLFETVYIRSPYRFTVIGYPEIFHQLTHAEVMKYYRQHYVPNNVFFVVVGDVDPADVVSKIRQAFSEAKPRHQPALVLPLEPTQTAPREIIEEASVHLGYVHVAWHLPEITNPDIPILDLVAALLGHGRSSRLYQRVREPGLVHSVDAWTYNSSHSGLFGMSATIDPGNLCVARDAVLAELAKMEAEPISPSELSKAVKQFISGALSTRKTMQGQAQILGANWISANDLDFSEQYLEAIHRATPSDIQRVVARYLGAESRTLYALMPAASAIAPLPTDQSYHALPVKRFQLANGLRVLIKEDHRLPFVEFRVVLRGGVLAESPEENGTTQLMSKLLLKGTSSRSAEEIATEIESVGGHIDSFGGNNSFGLHLEVLDDEFDTALNLLKDVLRNPVFPETLLERERQVQLAGIKAERDHLLHSAIKLMRQKLFGSKGYGLDLLGSEQSLTTIQAPQVRSFYGRLAVPENCVMAIYGHVQTDHVRAAVETVLGDWPAMVAPSLIACDAIPGPVALRITESRDKKQAVVVIGFRGTTLYRRDRYALELLQESCSDLGSRLFLRIREELGLAYYVGAQNFPGLIPGFFCFYAGTTPEKADLVEKEILAEIELLRTAGLAEDELQRAKAKIIGQRKIARQDLGSQAAAAALDELYGLGFDHAEQEDAFYEAVTLAEVREAALSYLRHDNSVVVILRPNE